MEVDLNRRTARHKILNIFCWIILCCVASLVTCVFLFISYLILLPWTCDQILNRISGPGAYDAQVISRFACSDNILVRLEEKRTGRHYTILNYAAVNDDITLKWRDTHHLDVTISKAASINLETTHFGDIEIEYHFGKIVNP